MFISLSFGRYLNTLPIPRGRHAGFLDVLLGKVVAVGKVQPLGNRVDGEVAVPQHGRCQLNFLGEVIVVGRTALLLFKYGGQLPVGKVKRLAKAADGELFLNMAADEVFNLILNR